LELLTLTRVIEKMLRKPCGDLFLDMNHLLASGYNSFCWLNCFLGKLV
jgi:hypothetical protein